MTTKSISYNQLKKQLCPSYPAGHFVWDFIKYLEKNVPCVVLDFDKYDFNLAGNTVNSCNWDSPLTLCIDTYTLDFGCDCNCIEPAVFTSIRFHKGGDPRGNYTDEIVLPVTYTQLFDIIECFDIDIPCESKQYYITQKITESQKDVHAMTNDNNPDYFDGLITDENCPEEVRKAVEKFY